MNHPFDEHSWAQVSTYLLDSYKRRIEKGTLDTSVQMFQVGELDWMRKAVMDPEWGQKQIRQSYRALKLAREAAVRHLLPSLIALDQAPPETGDAAKRQVEKQLGDIKTISRTACAYVQRHGELDLASRWRREKAIQDILKPLQPEKVKRNPFDLER